MIVSKRKQLEAMTWVMDFLANHPVFVRIFLRPLANAPFLSKKLGVIIRGFMGATAFEIHDVDMNEGRIGIGGVEEILSGSKIIHLFHTTLADHLDEAEKNKALYDMGKTQCEWEVSQALEHGRWAPKALVPLIFNGKVLDEVQRDPLMARFFGHTMNMMSRLITEEGGWGHLDFDFSAFPLKVYLENSQEVRWLGTSDKPVCYFYAGIVAGYASTIAGEELEAVEVACKSMGEPRCVFEVTRVSETRAER